MIFVSSYISLLGSNDEAITVHLPGETVMAGDMKSVLIAVHFQKTGSTEDDNWCNDMIVRADIVGEERCRTNACDNN